MFGFGKKSDAEALREFVLAGIRDAETVGERIRRQTVELVDWVAAVISRARADEPAGSEQDLQEQREALHRLMEIETACRGWSADWRRLVGNATAESLKRFGAVHDIVRLLEQRAQEANDLVTETLRTLAQAKAAVPLARGSAS